MHILRDQAQNARDGVDLKMRKAHICIHCGQEKEVCKSEGLCFCTYPCCQEGE
jgi:hypothetical protein